MSIVHDMPFADYLAMDALSCSALKHFARSPAHYVAYKSQPQKDSPAFRLGRLVHGMVLEPGKDRIAVVPPCDRRTKAGKAEWSAFLDANVDAEVVSAAEYDDLNGMATAVLNHMAASRLLTGGHSEVSLTWGHEAHDLMHDKPWTIACKGRIDYLREDGLIVDLKTCQDASPRAFARDAARYDYPLQMAMYARGLEVNGVHPAGAVLIAVEKTPPYAVGCYAFAPLDMGNAMDRLFDLLAGFAACQESDQWPAYADDVQILNLPIWARNGDEIHD